MRPPAASGWDSHTVSQRGRRATVRIYDPNFTGRNDTNLVLKMTTPARVVEHSGGRIVDSWRAFFIESYTRAAPPVQRN